MYSKKPPVGIYCYHQFVLIVQLVAGKHHPTNYRIAICCNIFATGNSKWLLNKLLNKHSIRKMFLIKVVTLLGFNIKSFIKSLIFKNLFGCFALCLHFTFAFTVRLHQVTISVLVASVGNTNHTFKSSISSWGRFVWRPWVRRHSDYFLCKNCSKQYSLAAKYNHFQRWKTLIISI